MNAATPPGSRGRSVLCAGAGASASNPKAKPAKASAGKKRGVPTTPCDRSTKESAKRGLCLALFTTTTSKFNCDACGEVKPKGTAMRGCRECDYDVCTACCGRLAVQAEVMRSVPAFLPT